MKEQDQWKGSYIGTAAGRTVETAHETHGRLLDWGWRYDLEVWFIDTFVLRGKVRDMRRRVVDLALARLLGVIGGIERRTFAGAGHVPQSTHPRQYVETVRAFLAADGSGRIRCHAGRAR